MLHAGSRGAYGAPRIHAALRRAGRVVNGKKVERLMRKHRIVGVTRRRRRGLTRQAKRAVFAADLIGRDFTAPRPGMRLVGDMTELITLEGKLYLATCIDLATRSAGRWPTTTAPGCWSPPCGWRPDAVAWRMAASCTPTAAAKANSTGRRNTF
ncbi:IS3 family transposase [Streptomyces sp. NY05-11A]|uniref:IS3 family transposase n=1 Tax=Streptomyces soliscabiei TaxID=588897 RepID=UPI0029BE49D0|nr:IS3 family transposase [Streptomyces sp. NY05-11A]MDX2682113.1 IS3 family transposase [Streptomyces sp. NY05-11A]